MRTCRLTRPKSPVLFTGVHRYFFPLLVQLGNEFLSKKYNFDDVGEIRLYYSDLLWHFEVFGNPDNYI